MTAPRTKLLITVAPPLPRAESNTNAGEHRHVSDATVRRDGRAASAQCAPEPPRIAAGSSGATSGTVVASPYARFPSDKGKPAVRLGRKAPDQAPSPDGRATEERNGG